MYLRILKKDLRRKKTMNFILLIFILLAAMFIASSTNNMLTISTALDSYLQKANVPDYWFAASQEREIERFDRFAKEHDYHYDKTKLIQLDADNITVSGKAFEYGNTTCISTIGGVKVFDKNAQEITQVNDGEIYITAAMFQSEDNDFYEGCKIELTSGELKKKFTLKGYTKDALFGSDQIGMTRFLVSENDLAFFDVNDASSVYSLAVYTDDASFTEQFNSLNLMTSFNVDYSMVKRMYIMDILIAAVLLVVSACLILISMVILRFTIHFTVDEEFREIGVMKAIGIPNRSIRGLYIVKYFAISVLGSTIGFFASIPFGNLLLKSVEKNIIISGRERLFLNVLCSIGTTIVVVFFCYACTRKIKQFSPIDAIRNGEMGERFKRKGMITLNKSKLAPIPFMAINDITSGLKRYGSMILIFTIGLLLIIIPNNTINTLQSDNLITWFSMAKSDLIIPQELLFSEDRNNKELIESNLKEVGETLREQHIPADVFQEILFRFSISHGDKRASSLAFQGVGEVTTDMYSYLEGTAPQNNSEVAISHIIADAIDARIGDDVEIQTVDSTKTYTVTAIVQSMNNLGEGIRFYQEEELNYQYALGCFGIQIRYQDSPNSKTFAERKRLLKEQYPDSEVYTAGEYISYMIGNIGGQINEVKNLIIGIVLCINMLVAILMVKSFLAKERGEIALLKAMGFKNSSLVVWQSMRIGIVLLLAITLGSLLSAPLSKLLIEPVFRMMGAYNIEFDVVPLETYVLYPLILLTATILATAFAACGVRKIPATDTANIE